MSTPRGSDQNAADTLDSTPKKTTTYTPAILSTKASASQVVTTEDTSNLAGKWEKWPSGWYFKKKSGGYATGLFSPKGDSRWYYCNSKGLMKTGWVKVSGKWYYANSNGAMASGWKKLKGYWYYLDPQTDAHPALTGFFSDGKARYYTHPTSCAMKTGWILSDGKWSWANSSGALQKGWKKLDTWYYLDPAHENYAAKTDYFKQGGKEYFCKDDCRLVMDNWVKTPENEERYADASGAITQFFADRSDGGLRILDSKGTALSGWQKLGNSWFYLDPKNNNKAVTGWNKINGTDYNFGKDYKWVTISNNAKLDTYLYSIMKKNGNSFKKCYNDISYNYSYRRGSAPSGSNWSIDFALDMAKNKSGNCYRYAALFAWVAKGLGYDAKPVTGSVPAAAGGWAPHGWVEIYYQGKTYICDPDLQHDYPSINFYWQTYASAPLEYRKN